MIKAILFTLGIFCFLFGIIDISCYPDPAFGNSSFLPDWLGFAFIISSLVLIMIGTYLVLNKFK